MILLERTELVAKLKTSMLKPSICNYSDAYVFVSGTVSVANTAAQGADANNRNKKVVLKNCASFTDCISEKNITQVDDAKDLDTVMPTYNLIEYGDNYLTTSGSLWQCSRDEPCLDNNRTIADSTGANRNNKSFNHKQKVTDLNTNRCWRNVKIIVPLKYLRNFWRALEMPLINCKITLILPCSAKCVIAFGKFETTFAITDTKLMFQLSIDDNAKLSQLKSVLKEQLTGININQK